MCGRSLPLHFIDFLIKKIMFCNEQPFEVLAVKCIMISQIYMDEYCNILKILGINIDS